MHLSIFLVVFTISINTYNIYAQIMKISEQQYLEVYDNFIITNFGNEIPNSKTALLYDLYNDEYDELITFYVSENYPCDGFVEYSYEVVIVTLYYYLILLTLEIYILMIKSAILHAVKGSIVIFI